MKDILSFIFDCKFLSFTSKIDFDLAEQARIKGCPHCGGTLHYARYNRVNNEKCTDEFLNKFHSLCCSVEGCRKRVRPLSIRYAGRSPFSIAMFLLVELLRSPNSKRRINSICKELHISERTALRWLSLWKRIYSESVYWRKISSVWMLSGKKLSDLWDLILKHKKTSLISFEFINKISIEIWSESKLFGAIKIPAKDVMKSNYMSLHLIL